jgi:DNA-binding transcriptional LysR family regulator
MLAVVEGLGVVLAPPRYAEAGQALGLVDRRAIEPRLVLPDLVVAWRANPPTHLQDALDALRDVAGVLGWDAVAAATGDDPSP